MTNKKLLKKTYILYLDNIDAGAENVGLDVEIFYEHFNPKHNAKLNKKLAKQLSRLSDTGYLAIKIQKCPFYFKYITFSPLMFYEQKNTHDKILSVIIALCSAVFGALVTFILQHFFK